MNRLMFSILAVLNSCEGPLSSRGITRQLALQGIDLSERTVRHYFQKLNEMGYTTGLSKRVRILTDKGRQELSQGFVSERIGFVINKINNLSFLTDFNPDNCRGRIILNVTYVPENKLPEALSVLSWVLSSPFAMSDRIVIAHSGEHLGDIIVPAGMAAVGTICSITLNGIFLKSGIPVSTKLGGIVEIASNKPIGFVSVISYESTSIPPLELFIKGRMTNVLGAIQNGTGKILGSFREIPAESLTKAKNLSEKLLQKGFRKAILFGQPGEPLLGIPVGEGKCGVVVLGGLNPNAALEEAGLATGSRAMATLCDYLLLGPVDSFEHTNTGVHAETLITHLIQKRMAVQDGYWSVLREL